LSGNSLVGYGIPKTFDREERTKVKGRTGIISSVLSKLAFIAQDYGHVRGY